MTETRYRQSSRVRRIVLVVLCLEMVGASIFFGAVYVWAWSILVVLSSLLFMLFWCDKCFHRLDFPISGAVSLTLALFSVSLFLQLLIPFEVKIPTLPQLQLASHYFDLPQTMPSLLSPYHAKLALYQWLIPIVTFIVTPYALRSQRDLKILLGAMVGVASLQGIYGIIQYLNTSDPFPYFAPYAKQYLVSGTYICSNTYACFMAMVALIATGFVIDLASSNRKIDHTVPMTVKIHYYLVDNPRFFWIVLVILGIISMVLGLFFSLSRGGVLCLIVGIIFFVLLHYLLYSRGQRAVFTYVLWSAWLLVPLILYLYIVGIESLLKRFDYLPKGVADRWDLAKATVTIFKHHWLLGCGGGCFSYALELYKPPEFSPYLYAHNDYLHFLAEYGIISFGCLLLFFVTWLAKVSERKRSSLFSPVLRCACFASLSVLFLHALFDFSLHIPSHRMTGALLMGALMAHHPDNTKGK